MKESSLIQVIKNIEKKILSNNGAICYGKNVEIGKLGKYTLFVEDVLPATAPILNKFVFLLKDIKKKIEYKIEVINYRNFSIYQLIT